MTITPSVRDAWTFNVTPSTLTSITLTSGTTTVTISLTQGSITYGSTSMFATGTSVTASTNGYNDVIVTVGDGSIDFTTTPSGTPLTPDEKISAVYTQMQNIKTAINTRAGSTVVGDNTNEYANAIDKFGVGKNIPREITSDGVYQMPSSSFTYRLPSTVTDLGDYALSGSFYNCSSLTSVDLSNLTTVGEMGVYYAFYNCTSLTSVDLSNLTTANGDAFPYAFYNCTSLTSINLSSLTTLLGANTFYHAFEGCTSLASVELTNLATLKGQWALRNAFSRCKALTDVYFRALTTESFGDSLVNQFDSMLSGTGKLVVHNIHFPSNMESTISGLTGYPTFGGTSGYVNLLFDLPATS